MTLSLCVQKYLLIGFGTVLLISGVILCGVWPSIYRAILKGELALTNTSRSHDMWKETPIPIYLNIYFFHWVNPIKSLQKLEKPNFIQKGPYVFREYRKKVNVTWNMNNTVTYMQNRKWIFMANMTKEGLTLSDTITTPNAVALSLASALSGTSLPFVEKAVIDLLLRSVDVSMYVTKQVRELLFEGYKDELLNILAKIPKKLMPSGVPDFDRFGYFYKHNMSTSFEGTYNMGTGTDSLKNLGALHSWNYKNKVDYYSGECGMIKGSPGELWPPSASEWQNITIFTSELCSSLVLQKSEVETVNGMKGIKFVGKENVFDNGSLFPENNCYILQRDKSFATGVRDLGPCRFNAPVYVSFPHFYLADPVYLKAINGLMPNETLHQFKMILDENTGAPLIVKARLQINLKSSPVPSFGIFANLPDTLFPVFWFEQQVDLPPNVSNSLWFLSVAIKDVSYALMGWTLLGFVLLIWGVVTLRKECSLAADKQDLLRECHDGSTS